MNATATNIISFRNIPIPDISDWKARAINEGCYKYMADFHEPNKVHYFKTLSEVREFVQKAPYHRRHNYRLYKMLTAISVATFDDGSLYRFEDLSHNKGGCVAYGDQCKSLESVRSLIGRANTFVYKQLNAQKAKK